MHRNDTLAAPAAYSTPVHRVAAIEALGLRAVLHLTLRDDGTVRTDFAALGADGRLRCGVAEFLTPDRYMGPDPQLPTFPLPDGPDALARALAEAVDTIERYGRRQVSYALTSAFGFGGWTPADRDGYRNGAAETGGADRPFGWLDTVPAGNEALCAAWDAILAPRLVAADLAAIAAFVPVGQVDFAAFDACRAQDAAGEARRAFARANPLLANRVLSDPGLLPLVDDGAPLARILDAASDGAGIALLRDEALTAPKAGLRKLSGSPLARGLTRHHRCQLATAAEALPREWMPRTPEEAEAFAYLCHAAIEGFGRRSLVKAWEGPWWTRALAGAGGGWAAYARRVDEACGPGGFRHPFSTPARQVTIRIEEDGHGLAHFATDLAIPLALAHEAGNLLALGSWKAGGRRPFGSRMAFHAFAAQALREGMDLPSLAVMGRRHREAREAIRAVTRTFPATAPELAWERDLPGTELCRLGDGRVVLACRVQAGRVVTRNYGWLIGGGRTVEHVAFDAGDPRRDWSLGYRVEGGGAAPPWAEVEAIVLARWPDPDALLAAVTGGAGIPALGQHPIEHGGKPSYDASAPGAIDAMLAAWRPVLPRRWRKLDAAGLAAALDAEAAAFVPA